MQSPQKRRRSDWIQAAASLSCDFNLSRASWQNESQRKVLGLPTYTDQTDAAPCNTRDLSRQTRNERSGKMALLRLWEGSPYVPICVQTHYILQNLWSHMEPNPWATRNIVIRLASSLGTYLAEIEQLKPLSCRGSQLDELPSGLRE